MNELVFPLIIAVVTGIITYLVTIRTELWRRDSEIRREQASKYFLPLKFSSEELYHRLAHIEKKIHIYKDINFQLPNTFEGKPFSWYFQDWNNPEAPEEGAGGYFLTTTIYNHLQVYHRINRIIKEYPFLNARLNYSLLDFIEAGDDAQVKRCYQQVINNEHSMQWTNLETLALKQGSVKLESIIRVIRLAAVMKGGIPYGLQPSFGQFIDDNGEQLEYDKFVKLLMDKEQRVRINPLINFYATLIDEEFELDDEKLIKLKALMVSLLLLHNAELNYR
ncbi:MAG: hypothetical protein HEP71_15185 [Roseivirga sp.]|nr:hypothetical protein [Roseivirga sp.]